MTCRLAIIATSVALLLSSATSATEPQVTPAKIDGAWLVLAHFDAGLKPRPMSTPLKPAADTCKDKCEDERDKCFNACPSDPNEGSVCRNGCSDTYDACQKAC